VQTKDKGILQMQTSAHFTAKTSGFFEIFGVAGTDKRD